MALVPAVFVFLIFTFTAAEQNQSPTRTIERNQSHLISLGSSSLSPPNSWSSPSGLFSFGFYRKGNGFAVGIWLLNGTKNIVVWTANRDDPPVSADAVLNLTTEGVQLLPTGKGEKILIANASGLVESASMLDSGNFVLFDNNFTSIWQSFDFPTNTLLGGQSLLPGLNLTSSMSSSDDSSGRFLLAMQMDGNLVSYPVNTAYGAYESYWSNWSFPQSLSELNLSTEGVLFLEKTGVVERNISVLARSSSSNQKTVVHRATLDVDGIFRLYLHLFENNSTPKVYAEWSSVTDECNVHGFCGFNSYCSQKDYKAVCTCYPGFIPVNEDQEFLECSQNFTEDICRKDLHYNMTILENIGWGDFPYAVLAMTMEDCSQSCQEDCNCGAVLYDSKKCKKYRLPLIYGKRNEYQTAMAFFKVILGTLENERPPLPLNPTTETRDRQSLIIVLSTSLGSLACLSFLLAIASFFMYSYHLNKYRKLSENDSLGIAEEFTLKSFSYTELEKVTDGFKEKLGNGNFGAVYKGTLAGGEKAVAVKRLETVVEQGEREFRVEMTSIGRTYHKNLVRLLGFCVENSRKLLVYEFMSFGSLSDVLFKSEIRPAWSDRVRIAKDVARGIFYLHEECEVPILHCNIKPQNILIDDSWTAKIADFGLAQLLTSSKREAPLQVGVASGYMAPEQRRNNFTSVKADIYSYGIVLFEIICCRRNIELEVAEDEIILSNWVRNCFELGKLDILVKGENVDFSSLKRLVKVGLWCIQDDPSIRPSIKDVMLMLEGTVDVLVPPIRV